LKKKGFFISQTLAVVLFVVVIAILVAEGEILVVHSCDMNFWH